MHALMRSGSIEVGHIRVEQTVELLLMKDQQMVKALTSHASQKAFADRIRSWRKIRRFEDLHVARCCYTGETRSELVVIISNQALGSLPIRRGFSQLLCYPAVGRGLRHTYVDDFARLQLDDEERKERAEEEVSDLQKIACPDLCSVIVQEGPPVQSRWREVGTRAAGISGSCVCTHEYPVSVTRPESVPLRRRRLFLAISLINAIVSAATFACVDFGFDLCFQKRRKP